LYSKVSHIIGEIRAFSRFDDRQDAVVLADKYGEILKTRYYKWDSSNNSIGYLTTANLRSGKYRLLAYMAERAGDGSMLGKVFGSEAATVYSATISLGYLPDSPADKENKELLKREAAEALLENSDLTGL
jgi:hypothetical protein